MTLVEQTKSIINSFSEAVDMGFAEANRICYASSSQNIAKNYIARTFRISTPLSIALMLIIFFAFAVETAGIIDGIFWPLILCVSGGLSLYCAAMVVLQKTLPVLFSVTFKQSPVRLFELAGVLSAFQSAATAPPFHPPICICN
jgi:hypothetical protein